MAKRLWSLVAGVAMASTAASTQTPQTAQSVLQSVAHGLVSASMFLLVGMVERRCGTGELDALGGMARGKPTLATIVLVAGMITLAVPGTATFAGEFLIMAGVYAQGWGYSVVVALGVVLAAMYILRPISAILHVKPGPAVREEALDLRAGELALVLPLLLVLVGLSFWPALVSESSFAADRAQPAIAEIVP
jgi:NADH-quinone oxidoreductase subunit M